ncbi:Cthe_2314 family HEPN domain-containing protein [Gorillibacterium massiliense]|uniref:Cthe_2314 family HEPN domain-containing protein n=1 Tax=Gorillibacterium massiliense TaxID=1280390 RepID=UPI0004B573DF|nr:Cthe_2314 family HEPN domain-containing protein [Gorillibacterium massiliense]
MLRFMFDDSEHTVPEYFREANDAVLHYLDKLAAREEGQERPDMRLLRREVLASGFLRSLDELEQSVYASRMFCQKVHNRYAADMSQQETDHYHRHLYFYKNALIRLFSILDKLGSFLDEYLGIGTDRIKPKFSYYTVLYNLRQMGNPPAFTHKLEVLKEQFKEPMLRLRHERNLEIHAVNGELEDDLKRIAGRARGEKISLEDISAKQKDIEEGFEMATRSLSVVFTSLR